MVKMLLKHQYVYLFLLVLVIIGFGSGYLYYSSIDNNTKYNLNTEYDFKVEESSYSFKTPFIILIDGILIIMQVLNFFYIFYLPFKYGFIFAYLLSINKYTAFFNLFLYNLIPFLLMIILVRISLSITKYLISYFIYKKRNYIIRVRLLLIKYIGISLLYFIYGLIIKYFI
mgnify:CR=1 FL=1